MKKVVATALLAIGLCSACGGGAESAATPSPASPAPTASITGRIMGPAEKARDTVDQLNDMQNSYGGDY